MNRRYQVLVTAIERAINEADPIELFEIGAPKDEYSLEISTILPRIANAQRLDDATDLLREEFWRQFGEGTGPRNAYEAPARLNWDALLEYRRTGQSRGCGPVGATSWRSGSNCRPSGPLPPSH